MKIWGFIVLQEQAVLTLVSHVWDKLTHLYLQDCQHPCTHMLLLPVEWGPCSGYAINRWKSRSV